MPVTHNAATRRDVEFASRFNGRREERHREDVRQALEHAPTRRLLMRLLAEARCHVGHVAERQPELTASVWDNSARIHYNAGRQDLGLLLQGWIQCANPKALVKMMSDAIDLEQADRQQIEAAHTTSASSKEQQQ